MDLFTRSQHAEADEILIRLDAPVPRRLVGVAGVSILSMLVIWHGVVDRIAAGFGVMPLLVGLGGFYLAMRLWRSSAVILELTPTELRESGGRQLSLVADIVSVNRGVFGFFKPANGFVLVTREKMPAAISAGVWWRFGKRVGVGGLTSSGAGKAMAELLEEMLKWREGKPTSELIPALFKQREGE